MTATSTHETIANCPECFALVNNRSYCRMMDSKYCENGLIRFPRLMGSSCFSKIIADVFPPSHCVDTQLNAAEQ